MAKKKNGNDSALVPLGKVPAYLAKTEGGSRGSEGVTQDDLIIPRLAIIQDLSGYVQTGDPQYIASAKVGLMINSLTLEMFTEVLICPVKYLRQELLWIP